MSNLRFFLINSLKANFRKKNTHFSIFLIIKFFLWQFLKKEHSPLFARISISAAHGHSLSETKIIHQILMAQNDKIRQQLRHHLTCPHLPLLLLLIPLPLGIKLFTLQKVLTTMQFFLEVNTSDIGVGAALLQ